MSVSDFQTGAVIDGRYRVLSRIGAGGMADVYLAEDQQLGRQVALKMLHRRFAEDPGFVERFRREAQAAASLQHPNVVSVFDRGDFGGVYYIAMEYLPGRSLKQLIRDEAPLPVNRAIDIAIQILKAARFAHRSGVIHRDLKPHNVIVDENDHAKVTDFGIARAGASDMTETGSIMGTAQYLSPEQAQGHAVSAPSDLYSVGIILYEMLTGELPFDGESPVAIALKQVSEAPVPPSQFNPAVTPALEQVVLWSLNKNPADRPASADEFIEALEHARGANGGSTATLPAVAGVALVGPVVPPPASTALIAAPAPGAVYGSAENLPPDDPDDRKHGDDGHELWPWLLGLLVLLVLVGAGLAYLLTRPTKVVVPSVNELTLSVATTRLETAGLIPNEVQVNNPAPADTVIGTDPDAGAEVKKGSTVVLTVSLGPGSVSVPSVVDLTRAAATKELKNAGLVVSSVLTQSSSTVPKGDATSTSPSAGSSVQTGSGVTLYVSSGAASATKLVIPDVTGDSLQTAEQALSKFDIKVVGQQTSALPPNTAMGTSPAAGTTVTAGSSVTLTVSVAPSTVPSVVGDTAKAAYSTLTGDGYKVTRSYAQTTKASQNGNVIAQSPTAGTSAASGTTVTLTIGVYSGASTTTSTTSTATTPTTTTSTATTPTTT